MNLLSLTEEQEVEEKKTYDGYIKKKEKVLEDIKQKRNDLLGISNVKSENKQQENQPASLDQVATYGQNVQDKSKEAVNRIHRIVNEDLKIADNVIVRSGC